MHIEALRSRSGKRQMDEGSVLLAEMLRRMSFLLGCTCSFCETLRNPLLSTMRLMICDNVQEYVRKEMHAVDDHRCISCKTPLHFSEQFHPEANSLPAHDQAL